MKAVFSPQTHDRSTFASSRAHGRYSATPRPTVFRQVFSKSSRRALQTNVAFEVFQVTLQKHRSRVFMVSSSVHWRTGQPDHGRDENGDPRCVTHPSPLRDEETKNGIGANHLCNSRENLLSHKIQQDNLLSLVHE